MRFNYMHVFVNKLILIRGIEVKSGRFLIFLNYMYKYKVYTRSLVGITR